eukprot:jgi/Psemu1/44540/gm1.44540_g
MNPSTTENYWNMKPPIHPQLYAYLINIEQIHSNLKHPIPNQLDFDYTNFSQATASHVHFWRLANSSPVPKSKKEEETQHNTNITDNNNDSGKLENNELYKKITNGVVLGKPHTLDNKELLTNSSSSNNNNNWRAL